jgi:hypothetical protein
MAVASDRNRVPAERAVNEEELKAIERRLETGDTSRAAEDVKKLLAEVRSLRGFIEQANAGAAREVLRDPPLP